MHRGKRTTPLEGIAKVLRQVDFWPKPLEDVTQQSRFGAIATIIGAIFITYLFVSETYTYFSPYRQDSLVVDTTFINEKVPVKFDIAFLGLNCKEIQVDVVDEAGEHLGKSTDLEYIKTDSSPETLLNYRPGKRGDGSDYQQGACRVRGSVPVRKVKGNLHVAAGASSRQSHGDHNHHMHRLRAKDMGKGGFNVSHIIYSLEFGDYFSGRESPLEQSQFVVDEPSQITYMIKLVPITRESSSGRKFYSYQYSGYSQVKPINFRARSFPLPGVFFKWDFASFRLVQKQVGRTFSQYLTRLCAIIGGTFVVLGLLYSSSSAVVKSIKKND